LLLIDLILAWNENLTFFASDGTPSGGLSQPCSRPTARTSRWCRLLRHATIKMTLEVYAQAVTPAKRQAQSKIEGMLKEKAGSK
jgi:hypothetical protein